MGKGDLSKVGEREQARLVRRPMIPRVGEVIVVRFGSEANHQYAAVRIRSVGTKWPKSVAFEWLLIP
jgi:hypothetical protein